MTYRVAIVGLGAVASEEPAPASDPRLGTAVPHSHAAAIAAVPALELVAGCDISAAARARFEERQAARWPDLHVYADLDLMLDRERPDLVVVATPDHLHVEPVLAALEAGVRMVLCEKPMATALADATRIVRAVRAANATLSVNHTKRWTPEFVEAGRLVRDGVLGRLTQVIVHHGGPRAMLFRTHVHVIDLLGYFVGAEPDWLVAELDASDAQYGTAYRGDGGYDPAGDPGANFYIAFRNGVRAYVMGMKDAADELRFELIGPRARLSLGFDGMQLVTITSPDPRFKPPIVKVEYPVATWSVAGVQAALLDLIASHEAGRPTASPPESGWQALAICEAILESQARGNAVVRVATLADQPEPDLQLSPDAPVPERPISSRDGRAPDRARSTRPQS